MNKENCALKLVDEIILYYDARSKKHQKRSRSVYNFAGDFLCLKSDCLKWFDLHFLFICVLVADCTQHSVLILSLSTMLIFWRGLGQLRYQSDGPGIDSRWCQWGFFLWLPPTEPCVLGLTQPLKMSTRDFYWGKGGRCIWLTTHHPCSAERQENPGLNLPGTPWATSACCRMTFTLYSLSKNIFNERCRC